MRTLILAFLFGLSTQVPPPVPAPPPPTAAQQAEAAAAAAARAADVAKLEAARSQYDASEADRAHQEALAAYIAEMTGVSAETTQEAGEAGPEITTGAIRTMPTSTGVASGGAPSGARPRSGRLPICPGDPRCR